MAAVPIERINGPFRVRAEALRRAEYKADLDHSIEKGPAGAA